MKKHFIVAVTLMTSICFAGNSVLNTIEHQEDFSKIEIECRGTTTSSSTTNSDGSTTQTTTTTVTCDTPQELATFHRLMEENGIKI